MTLVYFSERYLIYAGLKKYLSRVAYLFNARHFLSFRICFRMSSQTGLTHYVLKCSKYPKKY